MSRSNEMVWVVALMAALIGGVPCAGQEAPPAAPDSAAASSRDTYRLRVENAQYGRIEVSVDGGEHFLTIGRVAKPASLAAPDRLAPEAGSIVRSSGDGIAFAIAPGQVLKILPASDKAARGKAPNCAIVTDIKSHTGLFADYCPPAGTTVLQQLGNMPWSRFPEGLTPTEDTVFGFIITLPALQAGHGSSALPDPSIVAKVAEIRKQLVEQADRYTASALARAKESRRAILSGVVALRAKLPSGEPEPIAAVTYSIDGDPVSAQNTFPSTFGWDTTRVPNGEHVIEVRALSKYATVITRVRTLVVVSNGP